MGAIGPFNFVETLNGRVAIYERNGNIQQGSSLDAFFTAPGFRNVTNFSFGPRVIYDPDTQRFFVVAVDGVRSTSSGLLLAVSSSTDATDPWIGFRFDFDTDTTCPGNANTDNNVNAADLLLVLANFGTPCP